MLDADRDFMVDDVDEMGLELDEEDLDEEDEEEEEDDEE